MKTIYPSVKPHLVTIVTLPFVGHQLQPLHHVGGQGWSKAMCGMLQVLGGRVQAKARDLAWEWPGERTFIPLD